MTKETERQLLAWIRASELVTQARKALDDAGDNVRDLPGAGGLPVTIAMLSGECDHLLDVLNVIKPGPPARPPCHAPTDLPAGTHVRVELDNRSQLLTCTISEPWQLGDGTWVVKLDGIAGGYALDRIRAWDLDKPCAPA